jgi:hypothetical protein
VSVGVRFRNVRKGNVRSGEVRSGETRKDEVGTAEVTVEVTVEGRCPNCTHGGEASQSESEEGRVATREAGPMTSNAAAAAELAALVSAVEQCRSRLTSLAEARLVARRSDDEGDSLLTAIYEAERGLNAAIRMLQRAQRTAR